MQNTNPLILLALLTFALTACAQPNNERTVPGKLNAEQLLKSTLADTAQHNVIDNKTLIIKDSLTAINVVEPILFSIYGKENIIQERPYEVYFIDNYWVISGTLPKNYVGGTFLTILDARNGCILKITHGK